MGKTFITYSPELLKKNQEEMAGLQAIFSMIGNVADAKYSNGEMSSIDYAYTQAFSELMKDATKVPSAYDQCIIPMNSFAEMPLLETVILPYRAISIKKGAFNGCKNLKEVILPMYVKYINESFNGCSRLNNVSFPSSIKRIEGFNQCSSLEKVDLSACLFEPASNSKYDTKVKWDGAFSFCSSLKEIRLPNGITKCSSPDYTLGKDNNTYKSFPVEIYFPESLSDTNDLYLYGNSIVHFKSESLSTRIVAPTNGHTMTIYCPKGTATAYFNSTGGNSKNIEILEE